MTDISTNLTIILPAGIVLPFAGTGASPEGWELCNGQSVSKTSDKYSKLFAAIGITYGDDGGNFKLPALNNENLFIRGGTPDGASVADSTKVSSVSVGNESANHYHAVDPPATASGYESAPHSHTLIHPYKAVDSSGGGIHIPGGSGFNVVNPLTSTENAQHTHITNIAAFNSNNISASHNHTLTGDTETAPKHIKMQYIIKL